MIWLKTLLFTLCVPGVALGLVPYLLASRTAAVDVPVILRLTGGVLVALGVAAMGWCFARFVAARGTPAPLDPPKELVIVGLYRWVRNPMYIGAFTILLGEMLLTGSRVLAGYGVLFALVCHAFVVWYEEPALSRQFGAAYERYRATVPRWWPRRPRSSDAPVQAS